MSNARCVIYVINAINDIFDVYSIGLVSHKNMSIWVSNEASGPQEYRTMPVTKRLIYHIAEKAKTLTDMIFLCIF